MTEANSLIFFIPFFNHQLKCKDFHEYAHLKFEDINTFDKGKDLVGFKKLHVLDGAIKIKKTVMEKVFKIDLQNKLWISLDLYLIETSKDSDEYNLYIFRLQIYSIHLLDYSHIIQFFQNNNNKLAINQFIHSLSRMKMDSVNKEFIKYFFLLGIKSSFFLSCIIFYHFDRPIQELKQTYHMANKIYEDVGNSIYSSTDGRIFLFIKHVHTHRSSFDAKTILLRVSIFRFISWLRTKDEWNDIPEDFNISFKNYAHNLVTRSRRSTTYNEVLSHELFSINISQNLLKNELLIEFFDSANEEDFTLLFLVPLFKRMGFEKVTPKKHTEHIMEYGQDIKIMRLRIPTGHFLYFVCQVKIGIIGSSPNQPTQNIATILEEIRPAFEKEIFDSDLGMDIRPDHVFLIASGRIGEQAKLYLQERIQTTHRNLRFIERDDLIDKYHELGLSDNDQVKIIDYINSSKD